VSIGYCDRDYDDYGEAEYPKRQRHRLRALRPARLVKRLPSEQKAFRFGIYWHACHLTVELSGARADA
jgi:hypothetical protein